MEPLDLQRSLDKPFLQKRVLQKQMVLDRTSALQEEPLFVARCEVLCCGLEPSVDMSLVSSQLLLFAIEDII